MFDLNVFMYLLHKPLIYTSYYYVGIHYIIDIKIQSFYKKNTY